MPAPSFAEATRAFAKIGLLSFGGPAGQIALMHRVLVEEKRWLDEPRFLHALNYCMLLPGPEAMQLATYSGWLLHGVRGGLVAGLLFILPGAMLMTALTVVYLLAGEVTLVAGLLFGLKAAVLAIVVEALIRVSRRTLDSAGKVVVAISAFVAIAFLDLPFPLIVVVAGLGGALAAMIGPAKPIAPSQGAWNGQQLPEWTRPGLRRFLSTVLVWGSLWLIPLFGLLAIFGRSNVFAEEALFFSKLAAVTFGGAYAALAYVAQQGVDVHSWLQPDEIMAGLGLAETTPGPLVLVFLFVGFLGGARLSGFDPVIGGLGGALVALWFTFVPCFLWIFAGAPYIETVRQVRWIAAALAAVTAAVVGIIANLALWFGLHVLFGEVAEVAWGPLSFPAPNWQSFEPLSLLIAVSAGIALAMRVNILAVITAAAIAGALLVFGLP